MYNITPPSLVPNMYSRQKNMYKNNNYNTQKYKWANTPKKQLHFNMDKKQKPI